MNTDCTTHLTSTFADALSLAARIHADQCRKGSGTPYVAHLLAVTAIVLDYGATEAEAIAALLHDAVEDQGGEARLLSIREQFGEEVAQIVEGCSDTTETPKPPWRDRKEAFIRSLHHASHSVRLVVAADKLHNVCAVTRDYLRDGEVVWERFNGGSDGSLWYYREVLAALRDAMQPNEAQLEELVEELGHAFATLEQSLS